ncbi:MAG TPA: BON domain-containing protein [Candidatus Limnocylindria bacterium]|nr:BON domain-containing protein [Candidatus Limnocylindria bacterium]
MNHKPTPPLAWLILPGLLLVAGCDDKSNLSNADQTSSPDTNSMVGRAEHAMKNVAEGATNQLTAGDQGTSVADRELTQKIRQAVVSGSNNYSLAAKNIKIITVDGKVTLRGTVSTEAERTGIEALAKTLAVNGSVDNQLEVKAAQ